MDTVFTLILIIIFMIIGWISYKLIGAIENNLEKKYKKLPLEERQKIEELNAKLNALNSKLTSKKVVNVYESIKILIDNLILGEDVLYWTMTSSNDRIYITNKKIILMQETTIKYIMIEKINSIKKTGSKDIEIYDSAEKNIINFLYAKDRDNFTKIVMEEMEKHKNVSININQVSEKDIVDKIAKLKALYDEGILTEYEFNMKKMELLDKKF